MFSATSRPLEGNHRNVTQKNVPGHECVEQDLGGSLLGNRETPELSKKDIIYKNTTCML